MCSRCAQMFSDVHRCFQMITDVFGFSLDVLFMFSRCSQDVCRIFPGCFQNAPMGLVGLMEFDDHSKESMDLNDPKELDDLQLFHDPSCSMISIYSMINWKYGL